MSDFAIPRLLLAGSASNVGKTSIMTGLAAAFWAQGYVVQPFKAGPDYIDPTYHRVAAGRPSRNLDSWLLSNQALKTTFFRAVQGCNLALVEGVMGLFDGVEYLSEQGSSAEIARLLGLPIIVVLDVRAQARSAAATALGFARFAPDLPIAGFLLNRVSSQSNSHGKGVAAAIEQATGLPVFGALPRQEDIVIPERHLGLIPEGESTAVKELCLRMQDWVSLNVDLERLLQVAQAAESLPAPIGYTPSVVSLPGVTSRAKPLIAVARDRAFSFYYEDNLDLLRDAGAEIVFFSPLTDPSLPPGTRAIYLGGGFPEIYAGDLAVNSSMLAAIRQAAKNGIVIYAECGGLMYLTQSLEDEQGNLFAQVGLLPGVTSLRESRLQLGYRTLVAPHDTLLLRQGEEIRGHEFHYSRWLQEETETQTAAYQIVERSGPTRQNDLANKNLASEDLANKNLVYEGYAKDNLLASYVHLHFGTFPILADRFVAAARQVDLPS